MTTTEQAIKIAVQDAKFNQFMEEMRDFKNEMREQNKMRAEENREMRVKHDADMKVLNEKIDASIRDIRTFTIAAVVGIGAIVVSVIVFVANSIFNPPTPQIIFPSQQTQTSYSPPRDTQSKFH